MDARLHVNPPHAGAPAPDRAASVAEPPAEDPHAAIQQSGTLDPLAATGLLAAGTAHDFNNLLAVIFGSAEIAESFLPPESPVRDQLQRIQRTARRGAQLCRNLLNCAGTDHGRKSPVDVNEAAGKAIKTLLPTTLRQHRLTENWSTDPASVVGNAEQIRHLVTALLINAAEACGEQGGKIRVSTHVTRVDSAFASKTHPSDSLPPGWVVHLCVADNGCGMDRDIRDKVFNPAFSTKSPERGLGMAIVAEIVRRHKGGIRLTSVPGRSTTVDVYLPCVRPEKDIDTGHRPTKAVTKPPTTPGRILIADDEEALLRSMRTFITMQGLSVETVDDGVKVLDRLAESPPVDLLILDQSMPNLDGLETLRRMRQRGLGIPVILMSGLPPEEITRHAGDLKPAGILTKPFSFAVLAKTISAVLGTIPA